MSKTAVTVILIAVAVALTLAVVGVLAPEIFNLAQNTSEQIREVPLDFGD